MSMLTFDFEDCGVIEKLIADIENRISSATSYEELLTIQTFLRESLKDIPFANIQQLEFLLRRKSWDIRKTKRRKGNA